jgi:hypothetical protein
MTCTYHLSINFEIHSTTSDTPVIVKPPTPEEPTSKTNDKDKKPKQEKPKRSISLAYYGNHYDTVYSIPTTDKTKICQSIALLKLISRYYL